MRINPREPNLTQDGAMSTESTTRQELAQVESYLARLTEQQRKAEAARDRLVLRLADSDGAHSQRAVGVR